jgi:hypothetical protein
LRALVDSRLRVPVPGTLLADFTIAITTCAADPTAVELGRILRSGAPKERRRVSKGILQAAAAFSQEVPPQVATQSALAPFYARVQERARNTKRPEFRPAWARVVEVKMRPRFRLEAFILGGAESRHELVEHFDAWTDEELETYASSGRVPNRSSRGAA